MLCYMGVRGDGRNKHIKDTQEGGVEKKKNRKRGNKTKETAILESQ